MWPEEPYDVSMDCFLQNSTQYCVDNKWWKFWTYMAILGPQKVSRQIMLWKVMTVTIAIVIVENKIVRVAVRSG